MKITKQEKETLFAEWKEAHQAQMQVLAENIKALPTLINHPPHYGGEANPYEAIKVISAWGYLDNFPIGSVLKYICRAPHKGALLQDLEKAKWYLEYEIARLKREGANAASTQAKS